MAVINSEVSHTNDFMKDLETDSNKRRATRYVRSDIKAALTHFKVFKFNKLVPIQLYDISSRGALISSNQKLPINRRVTLILQFKDRKRYKLNVTIVRRADVKTNMYGLKFEKINDSLSSHILKTQTDLVFK